MAACDWSKGLFKGLIWGSLFGVAIGIFLTAKRKKGTWDEIGKSADALYSKTREQIKQAQREIEE